MTVTRACTRCKVVRPIGMFYLAAEARQALRLNRPTYRAPCRVCQRATNQAWLAPRYAVIDAIKTAAGCADCGVVNHDHPEIYDFDHRPGSDKVAKIATLLTKGSMEDLLAEVAKCDVVCSNCHRIRTRTRESNSFGVDKPR